MEIKQGIIGTVLLAVLAAFVIIYSASGAATTASVPRGELCEASGTWSEPEPAAEGGQTIAYSFELPQGLGSEASFLFVQSYWTSFEVQCGGQTVYSHLNTAPDGFAHLIPLGELPEGSGLSVAFRTNGTATLGKLYDSRFYIGSQNGVYNKILSENLYALVYVIAAVILSVVIFSMALVLQKANSRQTSGITALAMFTLCVGIWVLTDSDLLLLVTSRPAAVTTASFLVFYAMPLYLLRFTQQLLHIDKRLFNLLCGGFAAIFVVYGVNRIAGFMSTTALLGVEHTLLVVSLIIILVSAVKAMIKRPSAKLLRVILGYVCFCVCSAAALAVFYLKPFSGYSQIYALGTAGFAMFLFDAACRETYEQLRHNIHLESRAKLAYTDVMTNIGNRAAFHEDQLHCKSFEGPLAYAMVDINNLKQANDTLGHSAGDELITRTAALLKQAVGPLGGCYRVGGDEFVASMRGLTQSEAENFASRFYRLVEQDNARHELKLSAAAGCVWNGEPERDLDLLLRQADAAMYREKQRIKGNACT